MMVAYSFKAMFRKPILTRTKEQTIRAERKRHARPGEEMQLYTGMRTRQCLIIGRATCDGIEPISIGLAEGWVELRGCQLERRDRDLLARQDGFLGWDAMHQFWRAEHPAKEVFSGMLIRWTEFREGGR